MNANWRNATKAAPCPVCGHGDWCTMSNDGVMCVCRRVESPRPAKSGIGWIHILREGVRTPQGEVRRWRNPISEAAANPSGEYYAALKEDAAFVRMLAGRLGVSERSLVRLGVRRDRRAGVAAWPMRTAKGEVNGIRFRSVATGRKWSLKGGHDGLFMPLDADEARRLVVCEGASDAAAALTLGWPAVGRSSCMTGADEIAELVRRRGIGRVTIVADNDPPRRAADGTVSSPGYDGARMLERRLAETTGAAVRTVFPPSGCKDLRTWLRRSA